ncbi:hypothetical protein CKM354_000519800 [Cercospora kikuchii]|uniref:Uncharacterized protein n=1 Tax=Cercospora kikuchii TaxID=84275 RepID=A0A9P3FC80_9PEZI|nr:uncharacterized protein CKM354_000519800 [Cercospora kikuchii]GIZ41913.1 hypothetical protein CKM354_000519800 [Cercospora kikuchii]
MGMRKSPDTEEWLEVVHGSLWKLNTYDGARTESLSRFRIDKILESVKATYTAIKNSDAMLGLRERLLQAPERKMNHIDTELLSGVLRRILFQPIESAGVCWKTVQNAIANAKMPHFELDRIYASGCPVLSILYSKYADREDDMGACMAPKAAITFLVGRQDSLPAFGSTSWYIVDIACSKAEKRNKPLRLKLMIGIRHEGIQKYLVDAAYVESLSILCQTPHLIHSDCVRKD